MTTVNLSNGANKYIASDDREDYYINAGGGNDTVVGNDGNDTIIGGTGNDSLASGNGSDTFIYALGDGNDTITDYEEEDIIKFTSGTPEFSTDGDNIILKVESGTKKGKITLLNAKDKTITYVDENDVTYTWPEIVKFNSAKTKATLLETYNKDTFDINDYGSDYEGVKTIDGSAVDQEISIFGNAKNNSIVGGSSDAYIDGGKGKDTLVGGEGNDTLIGGKGNDKLYGNDGADVFIYNKGDGNDIIYGYEAEDVIQINSTYVNTDKIAQNGDDIIFTLASGGKISLKGAADKTITYTDSTGVHIYPNEPVIYNKTTKATAATLTSSYTDDSFSPTEYSAHSSSLVSIDASAVDQEISITGNAKNNVITGGSSDDYINGGKGKDTIYGGEGNDTLIGGKGNDKLYGDDGADVFIYNKGDGNDIIYNYEAEDVIQINSTYVNTDKIAQNGDDIIFTLASGGKISLKGAADKTITYTDSTGVHIYPDEPVIYNKTTKATAATLTSSYTDDSFSPTEYSAHKSSLVSIDASAVEQAIHITGNAKNNVITGGTDSDWIDGGKGADTLLGGAGNDTLTGGAGNDVFVYDGDGNDTITDYAAGTDKINFGSSVISTENDVGSDDDGNIVFTVGNGTLTLEESSNAKITYIDADGVHTYASEPFTSNPGKTAVTITADYSEDSFKIGDYGSAYNKVKTIDATQVTGDLSITGNSKANIIKGGDGDNYIDGLVGNDKLYGYEGDDTLVGGKGADSLFGGAGSDSLWGGKGNDILSGGDDADVFVFGSGEGNDIITDYDSSLDVIVIRSGYVDNAEAKNGAVVFTMTTGETLTLQNAAGKYAEVVDINNRNTILKRYKA